jgi:outer membrane immunogenic protein
MFMKKLVAAAAASILFAGAASAADLPATYTKAPPPVVAVYNWTGFYVGGNIGYGWGNDTGDRWDSFVDPGGIGFAPYFALGGNVLPGVKPQGVIGGGQIGYNWQASNWVFGVVADIQGSDMHAFASNTVTPGGGAATTIQSNNSRIDWFGTVRGRVGVAANNWLFYGSGGLAYGDVKSTVTFNCPACAIPFLMTGTNSSTQVGWAAGAGVEVGLSPNWTVGVEYLHFDRGSITTVAVPTTPVFPGTRLTADSKFAGDTVRGTLNYKFGGPVVAKY